MMKARAITSLVCGGILACSGGADGGDPRPPLIDEPGPMRPGAPSSPGMLLVLNRTDTDLTVITADASEVRVDHDVLEGGLDVPIPRELFTNERHQRVVADGSLPANGTQIEILTGRGQADHKAAMMIGFDDQALFLAVGTGTVFLRRRPDGTLAVEAEDPRAVTVRPIGGAATECAAGMLDDGYELTSTSTAGKIGGGLPTPVKSVTRDSDGCRIFTAEDEAGRDGVLRVCIPDAAYPFSDTDTLTLRLDNGSFDLGSMWRIDNADGVSMKLTAAYFADQLSTQLEALSLVADDTPTCVRIVECGNVDVPAKLSYAFPGQAARAVTFGAPIADPADASRTYVVLRARTRPVASRSCVSTHYGTTDDFRAHAWLALIEKGKPTE